MSNQSHDLTVVVAGSTSAAGTAVTTALAQSGFRVAAVDLDEQKVKELACSLDNTVGYTCNLADPQAVAELRTEVHRRFGQVDALIHLVGGWRGGEGIEGQTDADWDFLYTSVFKTLQITSRAFYQDLKKSVCGRLAIVTAQSVATPTADSASYAAVKSAAESWTAAIADGFANAGQDVEPSDGSQTAAATTFVVKALVDPATREANPHRKFPGYTDVQDLAAAVVALFETPASEINGQRVSLIPAKPATAISHVTP